jgi:hypothetical protein
MASDLLERLARVEGYNEAHPKYDLLLRYVGLNNGRENSFCPIIGKPEKRQPSPGIRKIDQSLFLFLVWHCSVITDELTWRCG